MNNRASGLDKCLPQQIIEQKTADEIEVYLSGRGKSSIHQSARNLSLNVSDDYGNRFLVELIQNAHDAHGTGTHDGRIAVVFAPEECEFGCLYVANRGNGFSEPNFRALTNIALSSKPVNESIGNKGLGFRSVLQICQWPEIYSVGELGARGEFDGYCFRFANRDDVAEFIGGPEASVLADEVLQNMPCWYLPVYASERPGLVNRFAGEKYASVVRIPLVSEKARDLVLEQFDALLDREHPLHLFLDRIACISLEREPGKAETLQRNTMERWDLDSGVTAERIRVGDDDYLVAMYNLDQVAFRKQLELSIARKEVPETWRDWQGNAQVSIAIRLGNSVANGLMYCFLPLGEEGKAPFAGYINANFYTKMDRRSVNEGVGLNKHFIDIAARLSCRLIDFLIKKNWPEAPGAVVDLLCWTSPYATVVQNALGGVSGGLLDRPLLPTRKSEGGTRWSKVREALIWAAPGESCLSAENVSRVTDAPILHDVLSDSQRASLERFFLAVNITFRPSASLVAAWVESIAQDLLASDVSTQRWADFYDEVAMYFRREPLPLFGKRFLLSVNRELIAAELSGTSGKRRRAADVYFPPVMANEGDADEAAGDTQLPLEQFPVSLQKGFAFLSRDIPWLNASGGYRSARSFFLEAKLVREYNTGDIIRTLAGITQSEVPERTKEQALVWAFRLCSSGRALAEKEIRSARIYVPTLGGWRSAELAMFGNGWATCSNGKRLEAFLKSAGELSADLAAQRECVLLPFSEWRSKHFGEVEWLRFLSLAGVRDHLRPVGAQKIVKDGQPHFLAYELANLAPGLSPAAAEIWRKSLIEKAKTARFSTVSYRSDLIPWRIPGQCDVAMLSDDLRKEYASHTIKALSGLNELHLKFRVYRPGNPSSGAVPEHWPTPLMSLLNETPWMPVSKGGSQLRFVRPRDAWFFNTEDEVTPRFIEVIPQSVAKFIDDATIERLRSQVGLRTLNDERDALPALAVYAETATGVLSDSRDVKRFRELFDRAWSHVAPLNEGIDLARIPVLVGDRIEALTVDSSASDQMPASRVAYFIDEDNAAKQRLLEELRLPAFSFGKGIAEDTWGWLQALAPDQFVKLSDERLDVMVDGIRFDPSMHPPPLSEIFGTWIVDFIVCVAEHKGGAFFQATQSTLGKVRHSALSLRLQTGKCLQISMAGAVRDLPNSPRGAVVLWPAEGAVLIAQSPEANPDLELLSTVATQLAVALRYPMLGSALDAAFLRLSAQLTDGELGPPDDEIIALVLGIPVVAVEQTRQYVRADLAAHLKLASLLAATLGEMEALEQLVALATDDDPTEEAILAGLAPVASKLSLGIVQLVERLGRASDPKELVHEFDLSLAAVNGAIRDHFPELHPISNEASHRRQLAAYLSLNGGRYGELLRGGFLATFDDGGLLNDYVSIREQIPNIEPDPAWFQTYDELPDDLLHAHVYNWLVKAWVAKEQTSEKMPTLMECRDGNRTLLRDFWQRFGKVLAAWVRLGGEKVTPLLREVWGDPSAKMAEYVSRAYRDGWLDFRLLDDISISQRLSAYGVWPAEKPLSTDLADWGISEEKLRDSDEQIESERERARLKRLKIDINGKEFSATKDNYDQLVAAVAGHFTDADGLTKTTMENQKLADADKPSGSGGSGGGSGDGGNKRVPRSPDSCLSDDQRKAVGLIGELYAKEWIRRLYLEKFGLALDDSYWVSGYRNAVLGTDSGNDLLGYDMIVRLKSVTHYYEVKASTGESRVFEMGPTEIAAAHKYRADKEHRYRVLYVSNATDNKKMKIAVLPNPFSKDGVVKLRAVGRGSVTFEFKYAE